MTSKEARACATSTTTWLVVTQTAVELLGVMPHKPTVAMCTVSGIQRKKGRGLDSIQHDLNVLKFSHPCQPFTLTPQCQTPSFSGLVRFQTGIDEKCADLADCASSGIGVIVI